MTPIKANEILPDIWQSDTEEALESAAAKMLAKGFTRDEVIETLSEIVNAMAGEYGD